MPSSLSIKEFHQRFQKRLQLSFASGHTGLDRTIDICASETSDIATADYLNIMRPASVVVIGIRESAYLATHDAERQQKLFDNLLEQPVSAIILSQGAELLDSTIRYCTDKQVPVFRSEMEEAALLGNLRYFLNQALTETTILHGVFVEVHSIGTFITGDSGVGKSELALSLISRGHRLIADDVVEFTRIAPGVLDGMHPGLSNDFMEVRGLGILNIRSMFGSNALKRNKTLRLVVNLIHFTMENSHQFDRLGNAQKNCNILDTEIPEMTLPVAPGRNLSILVEAAARNHLQLINGYNAAEDFIERQRRAIVANSKNKNNDSV